MNREKRSQFDVPQRVSGDDFKLAWWEIDLANEANFSRALGKEEGHLPVAQVGMGGAHGTQWSAPRSGIGRRRVGV